MRYILYDKQSNIHNIEFDVNDFENYLSKFHIYPLLRVFGPNS